MASAFSHAFVAVAHWAQSWCSSGGPQQRRGPLYVSVDASTRRHTNTGTVPS
jgi:hypothetical protein